MEKDILVAGDVQIFTDDCHSIVDCETGKRVNPFGGSVFVGEHVWIGQEALIFGNSEIGDFTVVGARSVVRGIFKNNRQVIAGTPARTVSDGVNWSELDLP